jgi:hypothetical protein
VISGQLLQTLCPAPGACPAELGTASSISDAGECQPMPSPCPTKKRTCTLHEYQVGMFCSQHFCP